MWGIFPLKFLGAAARAAGVLLLMVSAGAGEEAKSAPVSVQVPATAGPRNPVNVVKVAAGQTITLSIGHVLWKGGGSKAKTPTDWHGYRGRLEKNALPWMALVAAIGKHTFLPDAKEYTFTAPTNGELVLYANDSNPDGNSGKAEVTVTVR